VGKLLQFSWFFTQLQIYFHKLFKYVIPLNSLTTWRYSSILKCKKIGLYLISLNIKQDCWLWSYWSSQWGGNGSVENRLNLKRYYIYTIPQTEGKHSPHLNWGNTHSEGISCAIRCSLAAIQKCQQVGVTWPCQSAISIWSTNMQPQKFSHECPFCTLTVKVFPLKSFAINSIDTFCEFLISL